MTYSLRFKKFDERWKAMDFLRWMKFKYPKTNPELIDNYYYWSVEWEVYS